MPTGRPAASLVRAAPANALPSVAERLRQGAKAGLGSRRTKADKVPDRLESEEELVRRASGLADARRMRDAIVIVASLLEELEDLRPDEADRTAFHELADLFQDVADFAAFGAAAALRAGGGEA